MSKIVHVWWLAAWMLLGSGLGRAQMALDLTQAMELALTQNRELIKLAIALESRQLDGESAQSDFAWTARPSGSGGVGSEQDRLEYGLSLLKKYGWGTRMEWNARASESRVSGLDDYHRGEVRVELEQPLFRNAGRLANEEGLRRAESGLRAARRALELRKTDLMVRVAQGYEDILRLERQVASDEQSVARLDRLIRLTRAREAQGRVSKVDTLRVELQMGQAVSRLQNNREQWLAVQQDFADLLGVALTNTFTLAAIPLLEVALPGAEELNAAALSNRLDYAQTLDDLRDVRRGVRIAKKNLLPELSLIGRYGRYDEGPERSDAFALGREDWFVGLRAGTDFPLRKERVAFQQSLLDERSALENIADAESLVQRQVYQQRLAYERARADILIAARNLNLASNRLKLARKRFDLGRGDNFTVSDAEDEYLKAEREYLRAQSEAGVAGYRLLRVMGSLVEYPDDLKSGRLEP